MRTGQRFGAASPRAAAIKLRAERKAGELLAMMPLKANQHAGSQEEPALADLGFTKKESSNWQSIAAVPADDFETYIAESIVAEVDAIRDDAKERKGGRPKSGEKPLQTFEEVSANDRLTDAARAKLAGTNRQRLRENRPRAHQLAPFAGKALRG